jgi:tRNA pseudouridine55 synthase
MRLRLDADTAEFAVDCSAGTYVRQLVSALDDAYCQELERTAIGPFRLQDADPDRIVPLEEALGFMAERRLDPGEAEGLRHGRPVPVKGEDPDAPVRLTDGERLLAIGRLEDDLVKPVVVFHP